MSYEPLVWVTGAAGLIGSRLTALAPTYAPQFRVAALTREVVDLADFGRVEALFKEQQPALIIHSAALSQSPACQRDPVAARKINVGVTGFLAELASDRQFIFFSTDLVFDGRKGHYTEADAPNPLSVYGETKVQAEQIVLRNPRHTVVRVSLTGGISRSGSRGFNEELCNAWRAGKTTRLFTDEFRCPMAAQVPARAVWELAVRQARGLLHVGGAQRLSRLEIGQLVAARHPEIQARIEACSLSEYQGAPRPPDCSMDSSKAQALLSFPLPSLGEWLEANPTVNF